MITAILDFLQYTHSKGYIETFIIVISMIIYRFMKMHKKDIYTRIKCPNCGKFLSLKNGRINKKQDR